MTPVDVPISPVSTTKRQGNVLTFTSRILLWLYFFLYTLIFAFFKDSIFSDALLIVTANLAISVIFFSFFHINSCWPIYLLMYTVYFLVFLFKGVVQYAIGIDNTYIWVTIKTYINDNSYISSLWYITAGHLILAFILIISGMVASSANNILSKSYPPNSTINKLLIGSLVWVILSSIIMYNYGVAVMGTENVALPFRLSGILFYSRTIVIPMLLIYFFQKAVVHSDNLLIRKCIFLLVFLALNEIVVRATKAPIFVLVLQILFLYAVLLSHGKNVKLKKRYIILGIASALVLWPIIEVYRSIMAFDNKSLDFAADVADYVETSEMNYIFFILLRLFQRLVGFTQFAGLISDATFPHHFQDVLDYGDLTTYYTKHYLGYTFEGHRSSMSLLGATYILGGSSYWYFIFSSYIVLTIFIWHLTYLLPRFSITTMTFVGFEVFNTIMAGTMDLSLNRLAMVFSIAILFEMFMAVICRGQPNSEPALPVTGKA